MTQKCVRMSHPATLRRCSKVDRLTYCSDGHHFIDTILGQLLSENHIPALERSRLVALSLSVDGIHRSPNQQVAS